MYKDEDDDIYELFLRAVNDWINENGDDAWAVLAKKADKNEVYLKQIIKKQVNKSASRALERTILDIIGLSHRDIMVKYGVIPPQPEIVEQNKILKENIDFLKQSASGQQDLAESYKDLWDRAAKDHAEAHRLYLEYQAKYLAEKDINGKKFEEYLLALKDLQTENFMLRTKIQNLERENKELLERLKSFRQPIEAQNF